MSTQVTINWRKHYFDELNEIDENYNNFLYAIARGKTILYIGKAFRQYVSDRIYNNLERKDINSRGVYLWIGEIDNENSSFTRISDELICDVENLLIYYYESTYNEKNINNYNGRNNLRIINNDIESCFHKIIEWKNELVYSDQLKEF